MQTTTAPDQRTETMTARSADDQQAKLEGTLLSALVKRPAWNLGRLDEPGYLHASLTDGDYRGFIGCHRGGTWWWEAYHRNLPIADGRFPAGPTSNMRSAEQAIAAHHARNREPSTYEDPAVLAAILGETRKAGA